MKKCSECNIEMIEDTNLHTDYVGGVSFDEQIYLSFVNGTIKRKSLFGKEKVQENETTERVNARVCPSCGKIELFVNIKSGE